MNALLRAALDRTLRLMRDDLVPDVDDASLVAALTATSVVLVGNSKNLSSHSAQCAYITAALLLARSGHQVYVAAPDVPLVGNQPPLKGTRLVAALLEIGRDLLPGIEISPNPPAGEISLAVVFGDSPQRFRARRTIAVNATAWSARLGAAINIGRWASEDWPFGGLCAGLLTAAEAMKVTMHRLRQFARDPVLFEQLFAYTDQLTVDLAPADTPPVAMLGIFDFVSGGAITNATLFVLTRILGVRGSCRMIEPEVGDLSNLNRYALLLYSALGELKAKNLRSLMPPSIQVEAISAKYEGGQMAQLGEFAPSVLVGVDDIPIRWKVQEERPDWLGIGATSHWAAMASYHQEGLACARCLHPRDDLTAGPIPTTASVSFSSGLLLASYFVRMLACRHASRVEQYTYLSPLRMENVWRSPVSARNGCSICRGGKLRVA